MSVAAHVGARLETVAPRKVTDSTDRLWLALLVILAIIVHAWLIAHTSVTARDSVGFARTALQLEHPRTAGFPGGLTEVLRRAQHPPGYPLSVLATAHVVRMVYPADVPTQMILSTQIASGIAAVLLIFPSYWLGRMLYGKFAGFATALLFQVLPVPARITSDGLTEALFLLSLSTALMLGVRAIRKPGIGGFLLCGLTVGASYLVRPEGLLSGFVVGVTALGLALTRRWLWGPTAGRVTALGVGVILSALPYMILIGGVTNKPTVEGMLPKFLRSPREMISDVGPTRPLFAAWYDEKTDGSKPVWVLKALTTETTKTFHYVPAALALIGFIVSLRRAKDEPAMWIPILYVTLMTMVLIVLAYRGQSDHGAERRSYLSERHTTSIVYVSCVFVAAGLLQLPTLLGRLPGIGSMLNRESVPGIALAIIVASCVPSLMKSMHEGRLGHIYAGRYLAEHMQPEDSLVDPFEWAKFYSGRSLYTIPTDNPDSKIVYAVLEQSKDENPHSRLPALEQAMNISRDGRSVVVFRYPEENPKVLVYKLSR